MLYVKCIKTYLLNGIFCGGGGGDDRKVQLKLGIVETSDGEDDGDHDNGDNYVGDHDDDNSDRDDDDDGTSCPAI